MIVLESDPLITSSALRLRGVCKAVVLRVRTLSQVTDETLGQRCTCIQLERDEVVLLSWYDFEWERDLAAHRPADVLSS